MSKLLKNYFSNFIASANFSDAESVLKFLKIQNDFTKKNNGIFPYQYKKNDFKIIFDIFLQSNTLINYKDPGVKSNPHIKQKQIFTKEILFFFNSIKLKLLEEEKFEIFKDFMIFGNYQLISSFFESNQNYEKKYVEKYIDLIINTNPDSSFGFFNFSDPKFNFLKSYDKNILDLIFKNIKITPVISDIFFANMFDENVFDYLLNHNLKFNKKNALNFMKAYVEFLAQNPHFFIKNLKALKNEALKNKELIDKTHTALTLKFYQIIQSNKTNSANQINLDLLELNLTNYLLFPSNRNKECFEKYVFNSNYIQNNIDFICNFYLSLFIEQKVLNSIKYNKNNQTESEKQIFINQIQDQHAKIEILKNFFISNKNKIDYDKTFYYRQTPTNFAIKDVVFFLENVFPKDPLWIFPVFNCFDSKNNHNINETSESFFNFLRFIENLTPSNGRKSINSANDFIDFFLSYTSNISCYIPKNKSFTKQFFNIEQIFNNICDFYKSKEFLLKNSFLIDVDLFKSDSIEIINKKIDSFFVSKMNNNFLNHLFRCFRADFVQKLDLLNINDLKPDSIFNISTLCVSHLTKILHDICGTTSQSYVYFSASNDNDFEYLTKIIKFLSNNLHFLSEEHVLKIKNSDYFQSLKHQYALSCNSMSGSTNSNLNASFLKITNNQKEIVEKIIFDIDFNKNRQKIPTLINSQKYI